MSRRAGNRPDDLSMPESLDSERAALGALILQGSSIYPEVADLLAAEDFALEKHRRIFYSITNLHEKGTPVGRISVIEELRRNQWLESVDGIHYIATLTTDIPFLTGQVLEGFCQTVRNKSILRKAIQSAKVLIDRCMAEGDPSEVLMEAERVTEALNSAERKSAIAKTPMQLIDAEGGFDAFLNPHRKPGIPIPFPIIDRTLSGLRRSKLITVAARPALGKSALMWQCAESAAEHGYRSLVIALEMSGRDILHRAIVGKAKVSAYKFRHGELDMPDRLQVNETVGRMVEMGDRLLICEKTDITVQGINALMRSLSAQNRKPDVLFVDYLQILASVGRVENRNAEVSHQIRHLHMISKQFDIPVVVLSQLSRDQEKQAREPQLSDLRDSGSIEQESHQVIFLWAKDDAQNEIVPIREIKWKCAKNRDGMLNRGTLLFERKYARFIPADVTDETEAA